MYPPATMKDLVSCLQHYFQNQLLRQWSIWKDDEFVECRKALDAGMKISAREGNVKPRKRASAIPITMEHDLWNDGTFGYSNPKQLLNTLIYHLGLHFALRACQEHRDIVFGTDSQISVEMDPVTHIERLKYVERSSKSKSYGIKQCRMEPKVTYAYAHDDKRRCVVNLFKEYVSHRPESHDLPGNSSFYLTPIQNPKGPVWYKNIPVGVNTISSTLRKIMSNASDGMFYSNTSLRRTAKTRLTETGFAREIVCKKTGHLSNADISYVDSARSEQSMSLALYGDQNSSISLQRGATVASPPSVQPENKQSLPMCQSDVDLDFDLSLIDEALFCEKMVNSKSFVEGRDGINNGCPHKVIIKN